MLSKMLNIVSDTCRALKLKFEGNLSMWILPPKGTHSSKYSLVDAKLPTSLFQQYSEIGTLTKKLTSGIPVLAHVKLA